MITDRPVVGGFPLDELGPLGYDRHLVPRFFAPLADLLLETAPPRPEEWVLDLACGTGVVARGAASLVGPTGSVIGIDLNPSMIAFARSQDSAAEQSGVEWLVGNAEDLPLPDTWADVCYCQQGWQYVADQRAAARELGRVSRTGARLALAIWRAIEHNPVFALLAAVLDETVGSEAAATVRAPFTGPAATTLREQLMAAGFDSISIRITTLAVRFPSVAEFLRLQASGSPLGPVLAAVTDEVGDTLIRSLDEVLEPYVDDDGLVLAMQTWLVTARRAADAAPAPGDLGPQSPRPTFGQSAANVGH